VKVREESRQESRNGRGTDELIGRVTSICCTAKTTKVNNDDALSPAEESEWSVAEMDESTDYSCSSEARKRRGEVERVRICCLEGAKRVAHSFTAQMHADRPRSLHASLILARIP
jgi:hypothetical protein